VILEFSSSNTLFTADDRHAPTPDAVSSKIDSFTKLQPGWHFGEGQPVAGSAAALSKDILQWAAQLALHADAFPGMEGECMVAFYNGDCCVRVVVHPDEPNRFGLRVERGTGANVQHVIDPDDSATRWTVYQNVVALVEQPWISPAHSTSENTTILASAHS
jgi:hypothetical protein